VPHPSLAFPSLSPLRGGKKKTGEKRVCRNSTTMVLILFMSYFHVNCLPHSGKTWILLPSLSLSKKSKIYMRRKKKERKIN
jgi:hypothetical protein